MGKVFRDGYAAIIAREDRKVQKSPLKTPSRNELWMEDLRRKPILPTLALVLATLVLYSPVAHHQFLNYFDDDFYITNNVHVSTGLNLDNAIWAFGFHEANWHPLTWLSHMLDCQLFGLNPGPHHLVNVLLHAINVVLLFWLLQKATGAVWRSFLVAALFAFHPLNVETVAWAAERKSLLCTLFSLLTAAAYGLYARRPDGKKYMIVLGAFSLALMSKPMAVSLPFVLLLLDYWPLERYPKLPFLKKWVRLIAEKIPLFVMSVASSELTMLAQRAVGAMPANLPLSWRLENAVVCYVAYIRKMIWPAKLAVFYPHPWHALPMPKVIAATMILATITVAVLFLHRARYLVTGWFLFVVTLIPVIGIVQVGRQAMADRYAYVSCIGLFIVIAWGFSSIVEAARLPRTVPAIAALCLIAASAFVTSRYLPYWQDGVQLFTQASTVAGKPDFMIEEGLAENLASAGRYDEALAHYRKACELLPSYARCHDKIEELLVKRGSTR